MTIKYGPIQNSTIHTTSMTSNMPIDDAYTEWKYQTTVILNTPQNTPQHTQMQSVIALGEVAFNTAMGLGEECSESEMRHADLMDQVHELETRYMVEKSRRGVAQNDLSELQKCIAKQSQINFEHSVQVGYNAVEYLGHMDHIITNVHRLVNTDKKARSLASAVEHLKAVDRIGRNVSKNWENTDIYKSLKLAIDDILFSVSIVNEVSKNVSSATSSLAMPLHPLLTDDQVTNAKRMIQEKLQSSSMSNIQSDLRVEVDPDPFAGPVEKTQ